MIGTKEIERAFADGDWERFQALQRRARDERFDALCERGKWATALCLLGSDEVAAGIVKIAPRLSTDALRDILRDQWTRCEAHLPVREQMVALFKRVGYVSDTERTIDGVLTIYRGNLGEPEPAGISWTLDIAWARRFAVLPMTMRGAVLGMFRADGRPTVWRAKMAASDMLAFFERRNEQEVVVDPTTLRECVAIERVEIPKGANR